MSPSRQSLRVLVVDDEPVIADSLAFILEAKGHNVRAVYSAEEAIVLAEQFKPQVLVADVVMPGMDGIELSSHFVRTQPDCKVLLISGNAVTNGSLEKVRRDGHVVAFASKPVHPDEVLAFLASC